MGGVVVVAGFSGFFRRLFGLFGLLQRCPPRLKRSPKSFPSWRALARHEYAPPRPRPSSAVAHTRINARATLSGATNSIGVDRAIGVFGSAVTCRDWLLETDARLFPRNRYARSRHRDETLHRATRCIGMRRDAVVGAARSSTVAEPGGPARRRLAPLRRGAEPALEHATFSVALGPLIRHFTGCSEPHTNSAPKPFGCVPAGCRSVRSRSRSELPT